jgi:hypothetical protein
MSEAVRKQMIYLASVDALRRLLRSGKVEKQVIDRLNKKNAETMGCTAVEIA